MRFSFRTAHGITRFVPVVLLMAVTSGLTGCANVPSSGGAMNAQASMSTGATVAFESVDGPPPQVFERWVNLLDSEARLRNLAVVSRSSSAAFRVRAYLAAEVRGKQTVISWVWDVYDRDQQRALRLNGGELASGGSRDAWGSADDLVLRRIAQAGLTGLAGMINGTSPGEPAPPASRGNGPAIASSDELPVQATAFAEPDPRFSAR
jgi:hypothetical protein